MEELKAARNQFLYERIDTSILDQMMHYFSTWETDGELTNGFRLDFAFRDGQGDTLLALIESNPSAPQLRSYAVGLKRTMRTLGINNVGMEILTVSLEHVSTQFDRYEGRIAAKTIERAMRAELLKQIRAFIDETGSLSMDQLMALDWIYTSGAGVYEHQLGDTLCSLLLDNSYHDVNKDTKIDLQEFDAAFKAAGPSFLDLVEDFCANAQ